MIYEEQTTIVYIKNPLIENNQKENKQLSKDKNTQKVSVIDDNYCCCVYFDCFGYLLC
jgi:hypothetical protein